MRNFAEQAARDSNSAGSNEQTTGRNGGGSSGGVYKQKNFSVFFILPERVEDEEEKGENEEKEVVLMKTPRLSKDRSRFASKFNKISEKLVNTLKNSTGNQQIKGMPLYIKCIEFLIAFSISVTATVLCTSAFVLVVQQDYACSAQIQNELLHMGMSSKDASAGSQLWWKARPRIVTATTATATATTTAVPYSNNPFVPYLNCQYHLIESVIANNGALKSLPALPTSLSTWKKLKTLNISNNNIRILPHELLSRTMVNLIDVSMKGNPLYDTMLDLSGQQMTEFPERLCNLTSQIITPTNFGIDRWEWDLISITGLNVENNSLSALPINLAECLPCLQVLKIGNNPILHPVTPSLVAVWESFVAKRQIASTLEENGDEVTEERTTTCTTANEYGKSCLHEQWYDTDTSFDMRRYPTCSNECVGTDFVLDMSTSLSTPTPDLTTISALPTNNMEIDYSDLFLPLSRRCTGTKELRCTHDNQLYSLDWYFLNQHCGPTTKITTLNLKCSGISTFDINTIRSMKSLVHLDVSHNTFDTDTIGRIQAQIPWLFTGTNSSVSQLWFYLSELTHLQTFHMKYTTLKEKHFSIYDALYIDQKILAQNNLVPGIDFNVIGSPVFVIDWRLSLMPKLHICTTQCESNCCLRNTSTLHYQCDVPNCQRDAQSLRPPLWLATQLAPTLHSINLNFQEYYSSGNALIQKLCNGALAAVYFNRAFIYKTALPPCLWEQSTLISIIILRVLKPDQLVIYDEERGMDKGLQYLINGTVPRSLLHMPSLRRFECCDDFPRSSSKTIQMKYIHPLNGPLPFFTSYIQSISIVQTSMSGSIPSQWCTLNKVYQIYLHALPYVQSVLPCCLGNLSTLREIHLNAMPGIVGKIPWGSTIDEFNNVTIVDSSDLNQDTDFKNTKWVHLLNEERNVFRFELNIFNTNLSGNALPNIFPTPCYIDKVRMAGNFNLGGILSPTFGNCEIDMLMIKDVHFQGDFPGNEICNMCSLKTLRIDNKHNFSSSSVKWFKENCDIATHSAICAAKNEINHRGKWDICFSGDEACDQQWG